MTIRHFQIFKAVCDSDGITIAAERLNITQPSVSIAVRELENFYNTKLFDRINRRIYLTEEGALLRQYAESILTQYEEAQLVLRGGKLFSKCRLGVNISFAETHLASLIFEVEKALPDCSLHISAHNNEQLERMLSENLIDFAIYDSTPDRSAKRLEPLFEEDMAAVCAPTLYAGDAISFEMLSEMPLLLREEGSGARSSVNRAFLALGLHPKSFIESASTESLLTLAKEGLGFVFLPKPLAEKHCQSGELKTIAIRDKSIRRNYCLVQNEHKHLTKMMQELKGAICRLYQNTANK